MADPAAAPVRPAIGSTSTRTTPLSSSSNRADPRRSHRSQFHVRVRADALARQRAARGAGLEAARAAAAAKRSQQQGGGGDAIEVDAASVAPSASLPAAVEVVKGGGGGGAASSSTSPAAAAAATPRPFWARQLMQHEWMVDVPEDLASNWLVLPRPEGVRCLLVSGRGKTVARGRNGAVLHEFSSLLPGGGGCRGGGGAGGGEQASPSSSASEGSCVLDAIIQPDPSPSDGSSSLPGTFYALDALSWNQRDLTGCDSAFRLSFWLPSKLAEAGCASPRSSPLPPGVARVVPLRALEASPDGILTAVAGGAGGAGNGPSFARDGVLFLHKESGYSCDEASPLALVWKDSTCSRYVVETDAQGKALERQSALLRVVEVSEGVFAAATGDDPAVPLAPAPAPAPPPPPTTAADRSVSSPEHHDHHDHDHHDHHHHDHQQLSFKPGRLLRFAVGPSGFSFGSKSDTAEAAAAGSPAVVSVAADLEFVAALPFSSNRFRGAGGGADTLSKLLFQHAARQGTLPTLEGLLEASRSGRRGREGEEEMALG